MNRTITPLKAASLGILLVGLWLIVLGVWQMLGLYYTFQDLRGTAGSLGREVVITNVAIVFTIVWKILPLGVGVALFRLQRAIIRLFFGHAVTEEDERNHWNDTRFLSTLVLGLLGLFLLASSMVAACFQLTKLHPLASGLATS